MNNCKTSQLDCYKSWNEILKLRSELFGTLMHICLCAVDCAKWQDNGIDIKIANLLCLVLSFKHVIMNIYDIQDTFREIH